MLRIIFLTLPVIVFLSACESVKGVLNPEQPKEIEEPTAVRIDTVFVTQPVEPVEVEEVLPEEPPPVEEVEPEPPPEPSMTPAEARDALRDLSIPYSQASFIEYAEAGDLEVVKLFLTAGLDINVQPYTAVSVYVSKVDNPTALTHLEAAWYPPEGAQDNDTALMKAAGAGHLELVEFLIENGADVARKNVQGQTALMFAAAGGHLEVVDYIYTCRTGRNKSYVCAPSIPFNPFHYPYDRPPVLPVQWAAYNGHLDVVEYFAEIYIDTKGAWWPWYALGWAALGGHLDVTEYLFEIIVTGATYLGFEKEGGGYTAQHWSASHVPSSSGSALALASYAGHVEVVRFLLEQEVVDIFYRFNSWTPIRTPEGVVYYEEVGNNGPLHMAIHQGHYEILCLLLEYWMNTYGADGRDPHGLTALMYAAAGGTLDMAGILLDNGTPINGKTDVGTTALIFAAAMGEADMVRLLLDRGADPSVENAHGYTALSLAEEREHHEVVALLKE